MTKGTRAIFILFLMYFASVCSQEDSNFAIKSLSNKSQSQILNCAFKLTNELVQMIIEYSKWRNTARIIIVDDYIHSGAENLLSYWGGIESTFGFHKEMALVDALCCFMSVLKKHNRCFYIHGLSISYRRKMKIRHFCPSQQAILVSFVKPDFNQSFFLEQANEVASSLGYVKWFIITMPGISVNSVFETLALSTLSIDADVVVVLEFGNNLEHDQTPTLLPFKYNNSVNISSDFIDERCKTFVSTGVFYCLIQAYKIRKFYNDSLVLRFLGLWDRDTGTNALRSFQIIEKRNNFHKFPLILGKKVFTQETTVADENLIEDDNDEENMDKLSDFITGYLNAKDKTLVYPTLGLKGQDGRWNGLLGAVVQQTVDLGLDMVIKVPERYNDMSFSFDIMQSIRNIYVKPEESHSARDIFLIPFGSKMLLSVLATGVVCFVSMYFYLILIDTTHTRPSYLSAISEACFWVLGVFCNQGSMIQARSCSGKMVILMALAFSLLIYNSYSAFITSILSVKLKKIRTVDDLLNSNYIIAYTRNSQDEIYLRSMNNVSQLNQIYLRGYIHSGITNITSGLLRATEGNYGFFATGHVARKEFLSISNYRCKYDLMELPVKSTKNNVAFPLSLHSPYKKLINMGLIKMLESGVHDYVTLLVAPSLPICSQEKTFRSARINDLITCFILLGMGILLASMVVTLENLWKRKGKASMLKRNRTNNKSIKPKFTFVH